MRHAHDGFVHAGVGGAVENLIQDDDGRFGAFERKALVADEARMQEVLELFGLDDALERAQARCGVERPAIAGRLHAELQPALLLGNLDVHELASDFSAVGLAQRFENFAQGGDALRLVVVRHERAGEEFAVEVPDGEAVGGRIEFGMVDGFLAERIEVGDQVAAHAIGVDELEDGGFFGDLVELRAAHAWDWRRGGRAASGRACTGS